MKKILFLGYNSKETKIIGKISDNKKYRVFNTKKKVRLKDLNNIHQVICFGYKHIISDEIIKKKIL